MRAQLLSGRCAWEKAKVAVQLTTAGNSVIQRACHSSLAGQASKADLPDVGSVVAGRERAAVVRHGGDQVQRRARVRAVAVHPARVDAARAGQVRTPERRRIASTPLQQL